MQKKIPQLTKELDSILVPIQTGDMFPNYNQSGIYTVVQ